MRRIPNNINKGELTMNVNTTQASELIKYFLKAKLVPMLHGSPGIGKSAIVKQVAEEFNLKVIDVRLSQCDPTDINGFPSLDGNKAKYIPMSTFPIEGDSIPEGHNGWLLFLDEFNSAPPAVQASAYKLVLDRMVGEHHLHKNVAIVCAGNLETDNAIVQQMSTALQSRLVHLELSVDSKEWLNWAAENGIDYRIMSYINFKPNVLYTFNPDHSDKTFACPRTWHFADRILKVKDLPQTAMLPMLSGTLSEGVAREFITFTKIFKDLPTIKQIMEKPDEIPVPDEPSILYALSGSLSEHLTVDNIEALGKFIIRLPVEFQVITFRTAIKKMPELLNSPTIHKWTLEKGKELF